MTVANEKQLDILKQGVDVWNKWREDNLDVMIDLRDADLRNAILSGADLSNLTLNTAFIGANLSGANLTGASLSSANLNNAILDDADFTGAINQHTGSVDCFGTPIGATFTCTG